MIFNQLRVLTVVYLLEGESNGVTRKKIKIPYQVPNAVIYHPKFKERERVVVTLDLV